MPSVHRLRVRLYLDPPHRLHDWLRLDCIWLSTPIVTISTTRFDFYRQYFEQDNSLTVNYLFNLYHTVALNIIRPTFEFRLAIDSLPLL